MVFNRWSLLWTLSLLACGKDDGAGLPDAELVPAALSGAYLTQDFWVGRREVTQGEYASRMEGADPSHFTACGADCPVERVSWHMAAAYANACSDAAGLDRFYDCTGEGSALACTSADSPYESEGWRLLTEAEWEMAAGCGEGFPFAGSDLVDDVAWYLDNSDGETHPAGQKDQNACGLYDMSGNVWEWVNDWDDPYGESPTELIDPVGPAEGSARVYRGGSVFDGADDVGVSTRGSFSPGLQVSIVGLRLGRTDL